MLFSLIYTLLSRSQQHFFVLPELEFGSHQVLSLCPAKWECYFLTANIVPIRYITALVGITLLALEMCYFEDNARSFHFISFIGQLTTEMLLSF